MASSGSVPGKGKIRARVEKLSQGVPENARICVTTQKWHQPGPYREKVKSVCVEKLSREVPEKGRICVSTEK